MNKLYTQLWLKSEKGQDRDLRTRPMLCISKGEEMQGIKEIRMKKITPSDSVNLLSSLGILVSQTNHHQWKRKTANWCRRLCLLEWVDWPVLRKKKKKNQNYSMPCMHDRNRVSGKSWSLPAEASLHSPLDAWIQ